MIRTLYSTTTWLARPLLRRKLQRRALAEPEYGEAIEERFGHYASSRPAAEPSGCEPGYVWVHAVSLGETRACAALVQQLRSELPGMRLLLTHGTATGRAAGRALLQPGDVQVWQPWDTPGAVRRFLAHFQPRIGLLMETEVWPNLVAGCVQARVPLCLVNARMSEKSLRAALRLKWLSRPAYQGLSAVWAQSSADAQRLERLGAPVRGVLGNFKFDLVPDAAQLRQGRQWRHQHAKPVVLFASSREGEEQSLLEYLQQNRGLALMDKGFVAAKNTANAGLQWLIVPRHPQRFDAVARLFESHGYSVSRRSAWQGGPESASIWIGDTVGEMALYYGLADVALLGGSFEPLGGQNLIEAAACACAVVMGPHTFNFAQAAVLAQQVGAAFAVEDLPQGVLRAQSLLADPPALSQARAAAQGLCQAHQGAAQRTAQAVRAWLKEPAAR